MSLRFQVSSIKLSWHLWGISLEPLGTSWAPLVATLDPSWAPLVAWAQKYKNPSVLTSLFVCYVLCVIYAIKVMISLSNTQLLCIDVNKLM